MNGISMNSVTLLYLGASVCFIQALKGLSHPTSARKGNAFGMTGMAIAVVTTLVLIIKLKNEFLAAGLTEGATGRIMGTLAVALAAVNVFGGFLVTQRMLEMFKKKEPKAKAGAKEGA